ncbi:MAG: nucleotidyltransferase family protein [Comamonadaceae bacterium]|nr:MAG: nucleotidyltransferase family protein [Comamonadaceae bacterium]
MSEQTSVAQEPGSAAALARLFVGQALINPANRAILERLPALDVPDAWLVAGCLFQTVWNLRTGRPPMDGIRDYDIFYFDPSDLSPEAEDAVAQRVEAACADLGVTLEVKNQARVHTWYEAHFGAPYSPLTDAMGGIDRFLVEGTCVGLQARADGLTLYAPDGLAGMMGGVLRPNRRSPDANLYAAKARDYQRRWPWLTVLHAAGQAPARPLLEHGLGRQAPA